MDPPEGPSCHTAARHLLDTGKSFVDLQHLGNRNPTLRVKGVLLKAAEARPNGASVRDGSNVDSTWINEGVNRINGLT